MADTVVARGASGFDQRRAQRSPPIPRSRPDRLLEAKRRLKEDLDAEREANAQYETYRQRGVMRDGRRMSARPKPYTPPEIPDGKVNVTDPDHPTRAEERTRDRAGTVATTT